MGTRTVRTALAVVVLVSPVALAAHWAKAGWRDLHQNYPAVPKSLTALVDRFGNPCSDAASAIRMTWIAADTGTSYPIRFHRKLGGVATTMVADQNGRSTNLDNDVYGHLANAHLLGAVRSGIYGYACRAKRSDATQWSTHAWGVAVDLSSTVEPMGQCTSVTNDDIAPTFENHGWYWGLAFCDPMHFQYVRNY